MNQHVGDFFALVSLTGDSHYADVATLLLHNTEQMVQVGAEYGYVSPGYQIEHRAISRGRGYGLNSGWLPWVATSHVLRIWSAEGPDVLSLQPVDLRAIPLLLPPMTLLLMLSGQLGS